MLVLGVKPGDYLVVGEDVVVQVAECGSVVRLAIQAPKDMPVLRGPVYAPLCGPPETEAGGAAGGRPVLVSPLTVSLFRRSGSNRRGMEINRAGEGLPVINFIGGTSTCVFNTIFLR